MKQESRQCQNCKQEFTINSNDFVFYEKIKVPPPTFCPDCRAIRRAIFLNRVNLFKKAETKDGKKIFSNYPEEANIKIYDHDYWWSDNWNSSDYGMDVDFKRPFLEQLKELNYSVPWPSRSIRGFINSDYCSQASYLKNCYLCFNTNNLENCQYCDASNYSKDSLDCQASPKSELCYEIRHSVNIFQCFYCSDIGNCRNLWFCEECINCNDCFGCFNLRNKNYYIFNQPYSKEQYFEEIEKINTGSFAELKKIKEKFDELKIKLPRKYIHGTHNSNVLGEYIYNSKDSFNCYEVDGCENVCYSQDFGKSVKDAYDYTNWGQNSELIYEACACGDNCQNIKFCFDCWPAVQDSEYCLCCHSSSNLFGCVGLRSKNYCILNKQYSREKYDELVLKIKKHMVDMPYIDSQGIKYAYGEFFPIEFSPLAYNETLAIEYFPKKKAEVQKQGYLWRDKNPGEHKITIRASNLPDDIKNVTDDILKEVIQCDFCKNAYRLIKPELDFYKRFAIPLPRFCFNCRHAERREKMNPLKLWRRLCQCGGSKSLNNIYSNTAKHQHGDGQCPNEFETSYAPEKPEIVYCEECYQKEVY
jgi:hypothetical protein